MEPVSKLFVSAINKNVMIVAGGRKQSGLFSKQLILFNIELRKVEKMNDNAIALYATSSGTISVDGSVIGFV